MLPMAALAGAATATAVLVARSAATASAMPRVRSVRVRAGRLDVNVVAIREWVIGSIHSCSSVNRAGSKGFPGRCFMVGLQTER
jgi:hypothetical protein